MSTKDEVKVERCKVKINIFTVIRKGGMIFMEKEDSGRFMRFGKQVKRQFGGKYCLVYLRMIDIYQNT